MSRTAEARNVPTRTHGRYLTLAPETDACAGWLVGFHGYAQNAETLLELLRATPGAGGWLLVSVQALHRFYYGRTQQVVAGWMTRQDRELAIADNVAYVDAVLAELASRFGPPPTLVFAGYSQGVAMAYRAALLGRLPAAAILAAGGDLPPEFRERRERPWPRVLACTGARDEYYTPELIQRDLEALRANGAEARAVLHGGGHEWSDEVVRAAGELLAELTAGRS